MLTLYLKLWQLEIKIQGFFTRLYRRFKSWIYIVENIYDNDILVGYGNKIRKLLENRGYTVKKIRWGFFQPGFWFFVEVDDSDEQLPYTFPSLFEKDSSGGLVRIAIHRKENTFRTALVAVEALVSWAEHLPPKRDRHKTPVMNG